MTKTHLKYVVKLDDGTFAQWRTGVKNILIKEGEWKIVSGRSARLYVPRRDETATTINPPGDSTDANIYDLTNATTIAAIALRDTWDDLAKSASATIQLSLSPKALQRVDTIPHTEPKELYDELVRLYGTTGFSGRFYALRRLIRCELGDCTCSDYIHELKASVGSGCPFRPNGSATLFSADGRDGTCETNAPLAKATAVGQDLDGEVQRKKEMCGGAWLQRCMAW